MKPCALCGEQPRVCDGVALCHQCDRSYQESPEELRAYRVWEATGGEDRPVPDPWWPIAQTAEMDYVRRVQAERRAEVAR